MIRFFSKLRQRLLTDNKVSKYLLYAIGEILLVVIGILIALQIDNWNEDRKKAGKERKLLQQIEQDLMESRNTFERLLLSNNIFRKSGAYILKELDSNLIVSDSLLFWIRVSKSENDFNPVDTGYQAMLNSGTSEFKNDSLRVVLSNYFEHILPMVKTRNDKLLAIQWNHLNPFMLKHFKEERILSRESMFYNEVVTVPRSYPDLALNDTYANILHLKNERIELNITRLRQTQEALEQLIVLVQTEINRSRAP
ncbi:DUF6090 family protein [Robiginitalea sp. IMCC43444]|uniref:DUF6090 family protein n=1 Tax=Robiginitalea sp. IMCC43444 TaxID=3459121 RepID=UPI0040427CCB